jgi:hypothetical protein
MDTNTIPYTYLIGWSSHNKWYYGVRYATGCNPTELWKSYKTSSKYVKQFVKDNGDPDIIQIRKIFSDRNLARFWETKVLSRIGVINDTKWLNETNNIAISYEKGIEGSLKAASITKGVTQTKNHIEKRTMALRGKNRTEETKEKLRKPKTEEHKQKLRKPKSEETKLKISLARKGKVGHKHTEEHKIKMSIIMKGIKNGTKAKM